MLGFKSVDRESDGFRFSPSDLLLVSRSAGDERSRKRASC